MILNRSKLHVISLMFSLNLCNVSCIFTVVQVEKKVYYLDVFTVNSGCWESGIGFFCSLFQDMGFG